MIFSLFPHASYNLSKKHLSDFMYRHNMLLLYRFISNNFLYLSIVSLVGKIRS